MSTPMVRLANYINQRVQKRYHKLKKFVSDQGLKRAAIKAMRAYDKSLQDFATSPPAIERQYGPGGESIAAIYFSCHKHFEMLDASLRSLLKNGASRLRKIYIYEDASDPFTSAENAVLCRRSGIVTIVTGPRVTGWGIDTLFRELALYRQVAQEQARSSTRWMLKLDSDVLFLNENVFRQTARCDCDIFGQPFTHRTGLTYAQGGCYFIAMDFVDKLVCSPLTVAIQKLSDRIRLPIFQLPEDASIFMMAQRLGARVEFSDFYLPEQKIPTFVPTSEEDSCVIHFESGLRLNLRQHMPRISCRLDAA